MEEKRMMNVTVDGETRAYPYGTPYRAIAAACQREIPDLEGNQEEIVREYEEKAAALLAQEGEEIPQA